MPSALEPTGKASADPSRRTLGLGLCLAGLSLNRWSLGWLLTETGDLCGALPNALLAISQASVFCLGCALLRGGALAARMERARGARILAGAALGLGLAGVALSALPLAGARRLAAELELVEALFAGERAFPELEAELAGLASRAELRQALGGAELAGSCWSWLAWELVGDQTAHAELELSGRLPSAEGLEAVSARLVASWKATPEGWELGKLDVADVRRCAAPAPLFEPLAELPVPAGTRISSLCIADLDGDGREDLFATAESGGCLAYLARDLGSYEERARVLGLDVSGPCRAAALADFDNDGRVEVLVARDGACALYLDAGPDGRFAPADCPSLPHDVAAIAVGDVDRDGWLDAYLATGAPEGPSQIEWSATGAPVARGGSHDVLVLGVGRRAVLRPAAGGGFGLQAAFSDWDGDLDLDLCLVEDLAPARFLANDGRGAFTAAPEAFSPELGPCVAGAAFGDHDGDGRADLFATRPSRPALARILGLFGGEAGAETVLFWNAGAGYARVLGAEALAVERAAGTRAVPYVDLDGDGRLDLVLYGLERDERGHAWWRRARLGERGRALASPRAQVAYCARDRDSAPDAASPREAFQLFLNRDRDGPRFERVSDLAPVPRERGARAVAWLDQDRDGLVDAFAAWSSGERLTLYGNRLRTGPAAPRALAVVLVGGAGPSSPEGWSAREGHGARIEVQTGARSLVRVHRAAELAGASAGGSTLFGLGAAGAVERVTVRWPSGRVQEALDVPAETELWFYEDPRCSPTGTGDVPRAYRAPAGSAAAPEARAAAGLQSVPVPAAIGPSERARLSPAERTGGGKSE